MSKAAPTPLTSGLVSVKGQGVASVPVPESIAVPAPTPTPVAEKPKPAPVLPIADGYLKAMTLKLDRVRFMKLKQVGLDQGKTSQTLLTEAVDLLLKKHHG